MSRISLMRSLVDKQGYGLEIGPSHNPVAPKKDGYRVEIMDHLDREGLRAKYAGHAVELGRIEEVDHIWNGQSYAELVGRTGCYDWIVASHVLEHAPDLIGFMTDCAGVLADNGVVVLAVPDATRCFDALRPISGIGTVIDAHLGQHRQHTVGTAVEHVLNACTMDGDIAWDTLSTGQFAYIRTVEDARSVMAMRQGSVSYEDYHAWCFTPHSFRLMVEDLFSLGLIPLREVRFIPGFGFEFYMVLGRHGAGPGLDRLTLATKVKLELSQQTTVRQWLFSAVVRLRRRWQGKAGSGP